MIHIVRDHAEMRVDMVVVLTVVFVAGGGYEDRVQVDHFHTQILQIVQFVNDALNIAAVEVAVIRVSRRSVPVGYALGVSDGVIVFVVHHVVCRIPVAEPVRKNLVLYGTLSPSRHVEPGDEVERVRRIEHGNRVPVLPRADFVISNP